MINNLKYIVVVKEDRKKHTIKTIYIQNTRTEEIMLQSFLKDLDIEHFRNANEMKTALNAALEGDPDKCVVMWEGHGKGSVMIFD